MALPHCRTLRRFAGASFVVFAALLCGLTLAGARGDDAPGSDDAPDRETKAEVKTEAADEAAAEKPADKPAKEAAPKTPNPIGELIKRAFGGAKPARPVPGRPATPPKMEEETEPAEKGPGKDHIDARAPQDPAQARRLRQAKRALDEKNWRVGIEALQSILDQKQDTLIRVEGTKWTSVRSEAHRLLGTLPAEARASYELQFGAVAAQLLKETSGPDGQERLLEAASRYFHTKAGQEAANQLVGIVCDEGQYGLASRWIKQLLAVEAECTRSPRWKLKAALALHRAGDAAAAESLLKELDSSARSLSVNDQPIGAIDWLKSAAGPLPATHGQEEWPVFLGNASRTGTATGGDPLLLTRWSLPLTSNRAIQEQIRTLTEDLTDLKRAAIPAMTPLMVNGKVIFRTLRGFAVADARTGQTLWETREGVSAEQLLSGMTQPAQHEHRIGFGRGLFVQDYMSSGGGENHPLAGLLFRDANYGQASSDGRRLYVLEDMAILSRQEQHYGGWFGGGGWQQADPFARDWSSTKLTAYDLNTGRPLWNTGGEEMLESFDLPLAGTFFFGPPLPDAGDLFVIGEKGNEIHLHCLDGLTGRPQWSQLLANSEAKIEQDVARRRWLAQVATRDGILVCPTTVGWLVGVDRRQRSILWAHRYSKPSSDENNFRGGGVQYTPVGQLNSEWCPSAPMISGQYVVYAPTEEPLLICLNLHTGERLWERKKGEENGSSIRHRGRRRVRNISPDSDESLYVAGIFGDRVVVVGRNAVTAVELATGKELWTQEFEETDGRPAGLGVGDGEKFHFPLSSGQLWTLSLGDGKVLEKSYLPPDQPALGNLALYRGLLLSLSPEGMTSFEQRSAIEQEIATRRAADPNDPWALLRESDISLLRRDYPAALERLRKIAPEGLPEADRPRYRRSMIESLAAVIRSDFANAPEAELEELARFVQTEDEKLLQRRLTAERLHARGEFDAAFDIYLGLAPAATTPVGSIRRVEAGSEPVAVRLDLWIAGRLGDLWNEAPPKARTILDARIQRLAEAASASDPAARAQFAVLFGFHPAALPVRRQWIEDLAAQGEFAQAAAELRLLMHHDDPAVGASAGERLARLLAAQGLPRDAGIVYAELARAWPDVVLEGKPAREIAAAWSASGAGAPASPESSSWGDVDLRLQRSPTNYSHQADVALPDGLSRLPFFEEFRFQVSNNSQRMTVSRAGTEEMYWSVPLRSQMRTHGYLPVAEARGHLLYVLYRDVLHCLSPVDRRVLWTTPVDTRGAGSGYYRQANRAALQPMRASLQGLFNEQTSKGGMLAVANASYVCLYGRRQITVYDAATGAVRWTRDEIPAGTTVTGTPDLVLVMKPDEVLTLRATDGRPVETKTPADLASKLVQASGRALVLASTSTTRGLFGLGGTSASLSAIEPLSGRQLWHHDFSPNTIFSPLNDDEIAALRPDGRLELLDLAAGSLRTLGRLDANDLKSRSQTYVFQDRSHCYVLINNGRNSRTVYFGEELQSIQANGVLLAFDRGTGRELWKEKVTGQLVLSEIGHSPVMMFIHRTLERKGNMAFYLSRLKVLSKDDGRTLAEAKSPNSNGYHSFDINMADRYIELRSYNERVRLLAVERGPAEAEVP